MNEAGDRREAGRRWDAAESQPISMTERALVARIYALFDCFYDQLSEEHEQMRRARMLRARRPDEQSRTAPDGQHAGKLRGQHDRRSDGQPAGGGDAAGTGRDGEKRRRDGRRGELCTLPRGMDGQVSDADGGRHRDGYGGGAGFLGRRHGRRRRHVNVLAWHPEDFYPDPMYEDMQDGGAASRRRAQAWPGWSSTIHRRKAM